jgi:hypothetical protein
MLKGFLSPENDVESRKTGKRKKQKNPHDPRVRWRMKMAPIAEPFSYQIKEKKAGSSPGRYTL